MVHGDPELVKTAIKNKGFYDNNGIWNSITKLPNDDHLYRERVETIVVRNKKEVFVKKQHNGKYTFPGGSIEKGKSLEEQAIAECQEEAHFNITNIKDPNITYTTIEDHKDYMKHLALSWDGKYTHVFCAEYKDKYKGKVNKHDEDPFIRSGNWISVKECFKFFSKEHRNALSWYLKILNGKEDDSEVVEEGYYSNYFKNKHFLKKISNSPEVERAAIVKIINSAKKLWDKSKNTAKVKRIQKDKEKRESMFFPINTLDFPDGCTATVVLSYDPDSGTPAAAFNTDEFGDLVILYPSYFKLNLNTQIFTMLHEIGHIRLEHVKGVNQHYDFPIFGNNDTNEYRVKVAEKGKVMYPEKYADLYAILNGANLYSILDIHTKKDEDKLYDYRISNSELATRYNKVMKDYYKLAPLVEGHISDITDEPIDLVDYDAYGESVIVESVGHPLVFMEEKYADCPIDQFGIPETRSYPLNTKKRVYSACKLFGHAPSQYKKTLARNIFKAMKHYNIPADFIGKKSQLYNYIDLY